MNTYRMDILFGALALVLALFSGASVLGNATASSYFPRALSLLLLVLAVGYLIALFRDRAKPAAAAVDEDAAEHRRVQLRSAGLVFGAVIGYAVAISVVNFEISTVLFLAAAMPLLGYRKPVVVGSVAVGMTALLYLVFFEFLGVARPESLFLG